MVRPCVPESAKGFLTEQADKLFTSADRLHINSFHTLKLVFSWKCGIWNVNAIIG